MAEVAKAMTSFSPHAKNCQVGTRRILQTGFEQFVLPDCWMEARTGVRRGYYKAVSGILTLPDQQLVLRTVRTSSFYLI